MSNCRINIFKAGNVLSDKWVILELIGQGAMGEIYLAHQLNLKRDVAIKVVSEELLKDFEDDPDEIENSFQRFKREVHAMARVRHPNVLQIFDYGSAVIHREAGDCPVEFIAMEYIPGDTLRFTMSEEGFYPEQDLTKDWLEAYFLPVLDGVKAIHDLDIVHRDIKPENILMDGNTPKIADFGLARSARLKHVTQSMDVKGTAHYMSPEHFFDFRKADQRADIYSLGKILFEAITGKIGEGTIPFKTVSLPNPPTPFFEKLDRVIQDATAENRENRLGSVAQLQTAVLEAIDAYKKEPAAEILPGSKRFSLLHNPKWIWTGVVIAIMAVAAMTIWHLMGEPGKSSEGLKSLSIPDSEVKKVYRTESSPIEIMPSDSPKQSILAEDGASMHFVPAGVVTLPENNRSQPERSVRVNPFYMDETQVTNHQYVEFLNHDRSQLEVERGLVRVDDEIWLMLGEIFEDYEPIVFKNGEFKITNAIYTSLPVLRVTADGAAAYARFYNRRLPTYTEWLYALGRDKLRQPEPTPESTGSSGEMNMEGMHSQMQVLSQNGKPASKTLPPDLKPAMNEPPNQYGIRGLDKRIKEWGLWVFQPSARDKIADAEYVVLPEAIVRQPWEAFDNVGFRCVRDVSLRLKEKNEK